MSWRRDKSLGPSLPGRKVLDVGKGTQWWGGREARIASAPEESREEPEQSAWRTRSFVYWDADPARVREIGARALELLRSFEDSGP